MARTREEAVAYLTAQRAANQAAQPKRTRSKAIAWLTEQRNQTNASQQDQSVEEKNLINDPVEQQNLLNDPIRTIGQSTIDAASDMVQPILHPINTLGAIGNLGKGIYNKFTPGIQPSEAAVDAIGEHYGNRYGGLEEIGNTLITDPAGMFLDVAGIASGGGALAGKLPGLAGKAGRAASNVGRSVDPINIGLNAGRSIKKSLLRNPTQANDLMKSAVKFGTTIAPEKVDKMVGTMLAHDIIPDSKGISLFDEKLAGFSANVDDLIRGATEQGVKIKRSSIMNGVQDLKNKMTDIGNADPVGNLKKIDKTVKEWAEPFKDTKFITPEQAQKLKRNLYKDINFDKSNFASKIAKEEAKGTLASGARRALEKAIPGIELQNRGYGDLLELQKPLKQAARRIANRDVGGIGRPIRSARGAAVGGAIGGSINPSLIAPGAVAGGWAGDIFGRRDMPIPKAKRALNIHKLQNSSYGDIFARNNGLLGPAVTQGLLQYGRTLNEDQ